MTPVGRKALLLGSGELGKEVAIELQRYGVEVVACDKYANAPAMQIAHRCHVFNMLDGAKLREIIELEKPDHIIPEVEAIATPVLKELEAEGYNVTPTANAAWLTMNREGIRRLAAEELGVTTSPYRFASDYDEFKKVCEARSNTQSQFVKKHLMKNVDMFSNGETALRYFTERIDRDAIYLIDEPENSLSAKLQRELAVFLEEAVRFYGCQLVISTHSPFLLSLRGAKIYDLDGDPACVKNWSELENIRAYYDLFESRRREFE